MIYRTMLDYALEYSANGMSSIPCVTRDKRPALKEWVSLQNIPPDEERIRAMFATHEGNIGILTGKASGNLVCLDYDTKEGYEKGRDYILSNFGQTPCVVTSRGGHVYVRTTTPTRTTKRKEMALDVKANGAYVMAPPSIHKDGTLYKFEHWPNQIILADGLPFVEQDESEENAFTLENAPADVGSYLSELAVIENDVDFQRALRVVDELWASGRFDKNDLSRFDLAILQTCYNRGISERASKQALFFTPHYTKAKRLVSHSPKSLIGYLNHTFNAVRQEDSEIFKENQILADKLEGFAKANYHEWHGEAGRKERLALLAHIHKFRKAGKSPWNISHREGAELAGMAVSTFRDAVKRLTGKIIVVASNSNNSKFESTSYQFNESWLSDVHKRTYPHKENISPIVGICTDKVHKSAIHCIFDRKGLGTAGEIIYGFLLLSPLTLSEIRQKTANSKIHRNTISRVLAKMERWGIVIEYESVFYLQKNINLDWIAQEQGLDFTRTERSRRIAEDRIDSRNALRDWLILRKIKKEQEEEQKSLQE